MNEALRQQALLDAVNASVEAAAVLRERGARASRGLEAYRANAEAIAERALAAAFPTIKLLVGDDDFAHLAREFRRARPPRHGDLGEWGDEFAAWLETHRAMAAWPYLADCARLDHALHRAERAADASLDVASLSLLESTDPSRLHMVLMPGTALIRSTWPIAGIHFAHRLEGNAAERAFAEMREAVAAQRGEDAMVVRQGWQAVVVALSPREMRWTETLLGDAPLAQALDVAGEGFDFAHWLQRAIAHGWLKGVRASND